MPKIIGKHVETEIELKMNKQGGQIGDRSTGQVIEITNKTGGTVGAMFL